VRVHKAGGPEVLTTKDVELSGAGTGQIRIKQARSASYIDTYFRQGGLSAANGYPSSPAMRAQATWSRSLRRDRHQGWRPRRRGGTTRRYASERISCPPTAPVKVPSNIQP